MLFLKLRGRKGFLQFKNYWESCGAKHGTALLSHQTSGGLAPHADQLRIAIAPASDNQTPCPNKRAAGFLSLQEILFGRKIGRLKKTKTGGAACKARF